MIRADALVERLKADLGRGGLSGGFLVRDLSTGDELGIDPDTPRPIASLVKIPLAVATLERIRRGELDGASVVTVEPGGIATPGPTGISRFRHPVTIAVDDLVYLAVAVSDGAAADALFELSSPAEVTRILRELGRPGPVIQHTAGELADTLVEKLPPGDAHLAHRLAIGGRTRGGGNSVSRLGAADATRASARDVADWLEDLWRPRLPEVVAARMREVMAANIHRTRLAPEFVSDASRWWSKTGTLLNLRHEAGVVEHSDGSAFAAVVLTESDVAAAQQPAAEALMGHVARQLHDELRRRSWGAPGD